MTELVHDDDQLAPASPLRPMSLLVRDPVACFRYTMEAPDVRLGDIAIGEAGSR